MVCNFFADLKNSIKMSAYKKGVLSILVFIFISLFPSRGTAGRAVGIIMTGDTPYYQEIHESFLETFRQEVPGRDAVEIILQTPLPTEMSWVNAVRKLVALDVSIIVSYGAPATIQAARNESGIPVVFAGVFDPKAFKLEGRNVTGISSTVSLVSVLKNLKGIKDFSTLGIVYSNEEKDTIQQADSIVQQEGALGFRAKRINVVGAEDAAKIRDVDALFLTTSCIGMQCRESIIDVAHRAKIPTASVIGGGQQKSAILTITANPQEQGREAALLASIVFQGTKPSSLAMKQPKKVDVIINIKEATEVGVKIPLDLMTIATKIIK